VEAVYVDVEKGILEGGLVLQDNGDTVFRSAESSRRAVELLVLSIVTCHVLLFVALVIVLWIVIPLDEAPGLLWRLVPLLVFTPIPELLWAKRVFRGELSVQEVAPVESGGLVVWRVDGKRMIVGFSESTSRSQWLEDRAIKLSPCSACWQPLIVADAQLLLFATAVVLMVAVLVPQSMLAIADALVQLLTAAGVMTVAGVLSVWLLIYSTRRGRTAKKNAERLFVEVTAPSLKEGISS